jgi:hypothetical protein
MKYRFSPHFLRQTYLGVKTQGRKKSGEFTEFQKGNIITFYPPSINSLCIYFCHGGIFERS